MSAEIKRFRTIALLEGVSLLILFFIAMPLKYFAHFEIAVKIAGWIHGLLFIFYVLGLLSVKTKHNWNFSLTFWAFIASLLPFGTIVLDARVLKKVNT